LTSREFSDNVLEGVPKRILNCISDDQEAIESPQINGSSEQQTRAVFQKSETSPFFSLTLVGTEPEPDETDLGLARPFDATLAIVILGNVLVTLGL